jgi:RimJ/RimL family protein N-acetyltransferase
MRGHGHGRALLEATMALARGDGYGTLRLWTTDHPRFAAAKRLYEACDFVPQASDAHYQGHPVLIYSRALNGGLPAPFDGNIAKALAGASE